MNHLLVGGPRAGHEINFEGSIIQVPNRYDCEYRARATDPVSQYYSVVRYRSERVVAGTAVFHLAVPFGMSLESAFAELMAGYRQNARP